MKIASIISERSVILDQVAGWREGRREHISVTKPKGYLTLDPLPGGARLLVDEGQQKKEFVGPSALAIKPGGRLLIADAATHLVKQIDLATKRIKTLPAIGGKGSAARQLNQPRGVAYLPSGAIVVSDTGNHRVQIFSPPPYALLQVWGDSSQLRWPWAVAADNCAIVYIVDRGNHRVLRITHDGAILSDIGVGLLREPTRLALGPDNVLAVVDPAQSAVFVFTPGNEEPWAICPTEERPSSVAFDASGTLYVGDSIGLIHVFEADSVASGGYRFIGSGDTSVSGEIVDLLWAGSVNLGLIAIIREKAFDGEPSSGGRQCLWECAPAARFAHNGCFITTAIDSGIERCQWHRVLLDATVPSHTSIRIDSFTSDKKADGKRLQKQRPPPDLGTPEMPDTSGEWKQCVLSGNNNPDCLVQSGPGQYLWLRVTFGSNDTESPVVRSIKVFFPRSSYLQYLPAVFQEDDDSRRFLERFLSIFQTGFDSTDRQIDRVWQLFDPASVPERDFLWLASWVALLIPHDPEWLPEKKRHMLKKTFRDYPRRGTVAGLEKAVTDYAGVEWSNVLEHFRLRRWPALSLAAPLDGTTPLWSRDFYQRLQETSYSQIGYFRLTGHPEPAIEPLDWGAHKFTVFFPADPYRVEEIERKVSQVVEREKPAHTRATLCPVQPRFRIGVQATIGVDTAVGGISYLVLNQVSTLGYDSILACSPFGTNLRALGSVPRPRAGLTSKLS
jgi:phage tail-like protein